MQQVNKVHKHKHGVESDGNYDSWLTYVLMWIVFPEP